MSIPFVYFEAAPFMHYVRGAIGVELTANATTISHDGSGEYGVKTVAHLRCNILAAMALIDTLQKAVNAHEESLAKTSEDGGSAEAGPKPN